MSDKVTVNGLTTWAYPQTNVAKVLLALIGVGCVCCGIYGISASDEIVIIVLMIVSIVFCSCFATFSFYMVGSSEIVFDDNTKSIYLANKRCCFTTKSTTDVGPYSEFKEAVLKEELRNEGRDGRLKMMCSIHLIFNDGPVPLGRSDDIWKEAMTRTVASINEWWKTTPHYKAPVTQPQPVQVVVVQQTAVPVAGTQIAYQQAPPQGQGQVVYTQQIVYAQPPVAGQPVVGHPVAGQPLAGQPVAGQAVVMVQQQAPVIQGDAPPPSYESAQ